MSINPKHVATYPHIMAFGLQMQLLTDKDFPFPLLGLIHLSNRIRIHRPLGGVSELSVGVHTQNLKPHPKGATFDLITTVEDSLGLLCEADSRILCRGVNCTAKPKHDPNLTPTKFSQRAHWTPPA